MLGHSFCISMVEIKLLALLSALFFLMFSPPIDTVGEGA